MFELSDDVLESTFVNGLMEEVRMELRIAIPRSLAQIMKLSQKIEEKNNNSRLGRGYKKSMENRMGTLGNTVVLKQ